MAKDIDTEKPIYDSDKLYQYTWPGQPVRTCTGAALTILVRGADPAQLSIVEVLTLDTPGGHTVDVPDAPEAEDGDAGGYRS